MIIQGNEKWVSPRNRTADFIKSLSNEEIDWFFIGNLPITDDDKKFCLEKTLDSDVMWWNNLEVFTGERIYPDEWDFDLFRQCFRELNRITPKQRINRFLQVAADNGWQTKHRAWKKSVHEKDGYICQICGSNKSLHAHHVKERALFPSLQFSVDNGITLCYSCHKNIHIQQETP